MLELLILFKYKVVKSFHAKQARFNKTVKKINI